MSSLLCEVSVLPLCGQVAIQEAGTDNLPEWQTGEERSVSTERAIFVATRPDTEGDVTLRILQHVDSESLGRLGDCAFLGNLLLSSGVIEIGNALAGSLHRVDIGCAGLVAVRVFVDPPELPAVVTVVIDDAG